MNRLDAWFESAFQALTGHRPLRWQHRLFRLLSSGQVPPFCGLPTGLGKTAVIPIWLAAVAARAREKPVGLPRRLAYVVNRRTVVDQATAVVEQMRARLRTPEDPKWARHSAPLRELVDRLRDLAAFPGEPLAVSTLRGELADNEEWKIDPARAAVIIGTIDMIGSKLLFSGYGDGRYRRAHHAGLIGQDVLVVHDEAHLTPAFSSLLSAVGDAQRRDREPRPVHVMELSATLPHGATAAVQLGAEDERDEFVATRLDAKKRLRLHRCDGNRKDLAAKLADLAFEHEPSRARILIYVRSPEDAQRVESQLTRKLGARADERIALLTGTIRSHERDALVRSNVVYRAFLDPGTDIENTKYLVSTSAGEVGIDLDADHLVCDLTTLDAMVQRLGRVNRRGGSGRVARVDVVLPDDAAPVRGPMDLDHAMRATRQILEHWGAGSNAGADVCLRALQARLALLKAEETQRAFAPRPEVPPHTDILLDTWSLTSIAAAMPGRPEVDAYLHGLTADPPETYVVWRKEVAALSRDELDDDTVRAWFRACRIETRERLRDQTARVKDTLDTLLGAHRKGDATKDFPVILLDERGNAERRRLSDVVRREFSLGYRTVVLPVEAGGLNNRGMLDGRWTEPARDVADHDLPGAAASDQRRERWLYSVGAEGEGYRRLLTGQPGDPQADGLHEVTRVALQSRPEGTDDEGEALYLLLMVSSKRAAETDPESTPVRQALSDHTRAVVHCVGCIADALGLDDRLKETLVLAAERHDSGKAQPLWQWYACNANPAVPLAKSPKYRHWRALGGYRHEFGSLLDVLTDRTLIGRDDADLILHLIAAHHGWARPHFEPRAFAPPPASTAQNYAAAAGVLRRFGRLQRRFGRWGLAWLESLLRCADIMASEHVAEAAPGSRPTVDAGMLA